MKPLVGWGLGGSVVRERPGSGLGGRLGEPTWSPSQLLRDLELRLGLPQAEASAAVRVPLYSRRLTQVVANATHDAARAPFFARSFEVDSLGTAKAILAWRDALLEAGWNGQHVPGGGDRLEALAAAEALLSEPLPPGRADRLVRVAEELRACSQHRLYDALTLVEPRALWPRRWRAVLALLEERGCVIEPLAPELPGAPATTDLGVLQRMLRGELPSRRTKEGSAVKGDGSLLLLRGDTPGDLAELTAAILAEHRDQATTVVRCADTATLESALARQGLPHQGHASPSAWRPAMQLLPLALELAFEPRDPYRVLELLTLPVGPFQGMLGAQLARAVSKQPGVGGTEWQRQKERAKERLRGSRIKVRVSEGRTEAEAAADAEAHVAERMDRVALWLEAAGAPAEGAPRLDLVHVANRVRHFLQKRMQFEGGGEIYGAAYAQAQSMTEALARDERDALSREHMRQLLDGVVRGEQDLDLTIERAGRIDHVDHPAALLASTSAVVFWAFVGGTERRPILPPWHRAERAALEAVGVDFPDPGKLLTVESDAWRRGILAARERVVFVVPSTMKGEAVAPHPTWDEVAARLGLEDETAAAVLTRTPSVVLASGDALVPLAPIARLPLPEARGAWSLPPDRLAAAGDTLHTSPTALDTLATCPLRFVLSHHARLRSGALAKVANGPLLNGNLGHRLVEELHAAKAFDLTDEAAFDARTLATVTALLPTEGATLLLAGAAIERAQLVPQLVRAMRELRRYLEGAGWRVAAVEEEVSTTSSLGTLKGRLDVRLENAKSEQAVLDLKWGGGTYRALLEGGRAVQLAAYVRAVREAHGGNTAGKRTEALPAAGYFSLHGAKVLTADARMGMGPDKTLDGPTLAETWSRVEKTARAVQASLRAGKVPVAAATKRALPLLDALGIAEADHPTHYAVAEASDACRYCDYPTICGQAWEAVR